MATTEIITISGVSGQHTLSATFTQTQVAGSFETTDSISAKNQQLISAGNNLTTTDSVSGAPIQAMSAGANLETTDSISGTNTQIATPGESLKTDDSISSTNTQIVAPGESLGTDDSISGSGQLSQISAGSLSTTDSITGSGLEIDTDGLVPLFKLILTGAADGTTDIAISINSFQLRVYDGQSAYLSVTIPNVDYADEITARSNGNLDFYLMYAPASNLANPTVEQRIIIVKMGVPAIDNGSVNKSVTLTGYETTAQRNARQISQQTIYLDDSWFSYVRTSGGLYTMRMVKPHLALRAGDTVVYSGASITASRITWIEGENYHYMEIAEAA